MRYALVSDLHANLVAWKAVLADITAMRAQKIISLGDLIGYGPRPAEVLESAYREIDAFVLGNHDAVVAGKMSAECFNDNAKALIQWTSQQISAKGRSFLARHPLILTANSFVCTHGSLNQPAAFNYILSPEEALASFQANPAPLIFVGHSHHPAICVLGSSGHPHLLPPQDFILEPNKRYIVNVGSVGDPRDDDPRASYVLFDDEAQTINFRRIAFDYHAVTEDVAAVGLPLESIPLLRRNHNQNRTPVRKSFDFSPPNHERAMARDVEQSADLSSLQRSNHRLRIIIAILIISFASLFGIFSGRFFHPHPKAQFVVPSSPLDPIEIFAASALKQKLLPPFPKTSSTLPPASPIDGWRYTIANPEKQSISFETDPERGFTTLTIQNQERLPFILEAPDLYPDSFAIGYRVQSQIYARKSSDLSGRATLIVTANRGEPNEQQLINSNLIRKKPNSLEKIPATMKNDAFRPSDNVHKLSLVIDAEFSGTLSISAPTLSFIK